MKSNLVNAYNRLIQLQSMGMDYEPARDAACAENNVHVPVLDAMFLEVTNQMTF